MADDNIETKFSFWKLDDPRGLLGQTRAVALMRSDKRAAYKHHALIEFHWGWANEKYDWTSLASVRRMHAVLTERNPLGQPGMTTRHINSGNRDLCEWGWLFELEKGVGRNASRFLPNYALLDIAASGKFSKFLNGEISCSVSPAGKHNGYQILCVPLGDTVAYPYEVNANRRSVSPVGNKDSLTETGLQAGSTERENEPVAAVPPPVAGANAPHGADTPGEETHTTLIGFDELWAAYNYKRGKAEARRAYAKLAPDADLHDAMVESARKWREAWEAQNKPDAPRYSLAKWIEREDYECEPPTAYKPKERKAKATNTDMPATKAKGKLAEPLRVIEAEYIGSAFSDYGLRLKLDGPAGECEHTLQILSVSGPGEHYDIFTKLRAALKLDPTDWPGQRLRLKMDGNIIVDAVPERQHDRIVKIAEANIVDLDDDRILVATLVDLAGKPEGQIDIVIRSQDYDEEHEGHEKVARLFEAVDLDANPDTDLNELVGRVFKLTGEGDFRRTPSQVEEAA